MASEDLPLSIDDLKYDAMHKLVQLIFCQRVSPGLIPKLEEIGRETILDMRDDTKFTFVKFKPHEWRKRFRVNHGDITLKGAIKIFLDKLPNCFPTILYCETVDCFVLMGLQIDLFDEDTMIDGEINTQLYYVVNGKSIFSKLVLLGKNIEYIIEQVSSSKQKSTCEKCGKRSFIKLKLCTRCRKVRYCDKKCQKGHWKEHKKVCKK